MKPPRTPEQMTEDVNNLNCHGSQPTHNPVTVAQMQDIYAEARKMEWTNRKPDMPGWWWYMARGSTYPEVAHVWSTPEGLRCTRTTSSKFLCRVTGQWSTRPIDMPE